MVLPACAAAPEPAGPVAPLRRLRDHGRLRPALQALSRKHAQGVVTMAPQVLETGLAAPWEVSERVRPDNGSLFADSAAATGGQVGALVVRDTDFEVLEAHHEAFTSRLAE